MSKPFRTNYLEAPLPGDIIIVGGDYYRVAVAEPEYPATCMGCYLWEHKNRMPPELCVEARCCGHGTILKKLDPLHEDLLIVKENNNGSTQT
jgi:hypothetical protein